jgi:hypothetical protein
MDRNYIEVRFYYPDSMRESVDGEALKDKLYDDFVGVGAPTDDQPFTDITYMDSSQVPDAWLPHEEEEESEDE